MICRFAAAQKLCGGHVKGATKAYSNKTSRTSSKVKRAADATLTSGEKFS
jgi:hypothetical protein